MTHLVPFSFESQTVRIADKNGEPWFVLMDVCAVLDITNSGNAAARLDADEKGVHTMDTPGGRQDMVIINESGLWSLVLTSRKPNAKRFKKWITAEVIPSIRKTGGYSVAHRVQPDHAPRLEVAREHRLAMASNLRIAKMIGLDGNQAVFSANRATVQMTGIDTLGLMGITHVKAPTNDVLLTPTEIGMRLGNKSGQRINLLLCDMGLQSRFPKLGGGWHYEPTDEGVKAGAVMQDTGKSHGDGSPVRHLKWESSVTDRIERWLEERGAA